MKVQPIGTARTTVVRKNGSKDPIIDKAIQMLTPDIEIVLDHITVKRGDVNLTQTMRNRILAQGRRLQVLVRVCWQDNDDKTERHPVVMLETRKNFVKQASKLS